MILPDFINVKNVLTIGKQIFKKDSCSASVEQVKKTKEQ